MADEFDFPNLTFAEIKKLKVVELKARLTQLGLPVSGLKADLVARLASFLESRAIQAAFDESKDQEGPSHVEDIPEQVSAVVSHIASEVSSDKPDGNVLMHMDKSADSDNEKNTQNDAVQVEQGSTTVGDEQKQQTEEKQVEIQPDEGMDRTGAEPDRIHSKETELGGLTIGQKILRPAEEQSLVHQHQVEKGIADSITVDQPHSVNRDESETQGDNLVVAEQYVSDNAAVGQGISTTDDSVASADDMETEMAHESVPEVPTRSDSQEPAVTPETSKPSVEETSHPSFGSPEETSSFVPHPTSPSFQPPAQAPTMPIIQPPSASPPHLQSQQISQTPSPPASSLPDNLQVEVEPTPPDRTGTPPKDTPSDEPTPQEDVPQGTSPTVAPTSPDPLAEAKAKARSVVEMRERRLNEESQSGTRDDDSGYDVDHYEQEVTPPTESRQEKKKKKKKKRKKKNNVQTNVPSEVAPDDEGIEVEYVPEKLDVKDPVYAQFASIFETFKLSEKPDPTKKDETKDKSEDKTAEAAKKDDDEMDTDSEEEEIQKEEQPGEKVEKLSKKKLKLKNRMSVAELKQTVHRPDVVEMHDVTAPDPKLLVYLKACRNTVPVPRHWCFKRKFLQGKRGIIKPPFQLPEFIQKTGIMEMREALQEKEDAKNMKAKMREKIRPKMGKIDIDYQKLHDAFFKWQTKPKMSIHGDLYYEGKEFETKLKEKKPGDLSEDLRTALGMPTGQGSNLVPPPWLIAMQRYGPPPSYPNLKIRGLNAPIPDGASFGYHAGGWGKPPVDEHGRPLYGDVFGVLQTDMNLMDDEVVDSNLWGELESESEESEESEEESEEEAPDQSGLVTPAETGLVTPSGLTSIPAGMETPDMIELRKRKNIEDAMESGSEQPTLYTVLPEKRAGVGGMMMGTSHVYDLATATAPTGARKGPGGLSEGVEVALDPSELELDPAAMQARYDEQLREQQNTQKEDFSDMVAEHAARQQKKRKKTTESGKAAKKYKEFKF